jgi:ribonucleoside-triphosphate reductase
LGGTRLIEIPWSNLGYLVAKRTYTRLLDMNLGPDSPTEEWEDVIERVLEACETQLDVGFTEEEKDRAREYMLRLKSSVAGRFLWQLGTPTVDRIGLASLQNCAFTSVDHPIRPFTWTMDMLALGSGVGYNVQKHNINKLPEVKDWFCAPTRWDDGGADFIVPDSREGWVRLLGKTLKAAFLSHSPEKGTFTYSTQVIRGAGSLIKGFGGVAQGPEALVEGITEIAKILEKRRGKKIRPIDALDIMNLIGWIIVSGNVRRSAQIALGDPDDLEFINAKRWDLGEIPKWRAQSNNSVITDNITKLPPDFWEGYKGNGEPLGLVNLDLCKKIGRLGDYRYPDPDVKGVNPF